MWTDCFTLPDVAHKLYTQPFPLIDVTIIDDNELVNHRKIAVMELAMKHKQRRNQFQIVVPPLARALNQHYNNDDDVIAILNYLFTTLDTPNFEQILRDLEQQTEKHKEPIVSIAQRLQNKGRQEGILQGRAEGRIEGRVEGRVVGMREAQISMARNLLRNGISLELIMESTDLSREELISLQ